MNGNRFSLLSYLDHATRTAQAWAYDEVWGVCKHHGVERVCDNIRVTSSRKVSNSEWFAKVTLAEVKVQLALRLHS
jgi:hypothetical protein